MNGINTTENTPIVGLQLIRYNRTELEEKKINSLSELDKCFDESNDVSWLDVDGTHCKNTIDFLTNKLCLHRLLVGDILQKNHRPKTEEYENHIFVLVNMLEFDERTRKIKSEQVSFILGKNFLVSIQESHRAGDIFDPVRMRLKNTQSQHRKLGPDYLLYSLLDGIIDHYFIILEKIGEQIEEMENEILNQPTPQKLKEIYILKRELIQLRHSVWPLREVVNKLNKGFNETFIKPNTLIYFRESYDHSIQVIETLESYRDILSGLIDIYLSSLSNKMNNVMKVLTVISTIFMPLTFIVGLYGMNFENMPELKWTYGYFIVLGLCTGIVGTMIIYFKKKNWL